MPLSQLLDTAETVATGSAEVAAEKWSAIVLGVVALVVFLVIAVTLAVAPVVGVGLIILVFGVISLADDGGELI